MQNLTAQEWDVVVAALMLYKRETLAEQDPSWASELALMKSALIKARANRDTQETKENQEGF